MSKYLAAAAGISLLFLAGCDLERVSAGAIQNESRTVDRDKSELVRAEIKLGAGELHVRGGAEKLLEANFRYNVPAWKPEIRYHATGFRGVLSIEQPGHGGPGKDVTYDWDLRFNNDTPLDMIVHVGAGEARLDAGSLWLRSLEVNMGVGELKLDLRGTPKQDYDVRVRGGVGEATIQLPTGVGVMAEATGGLGGVNVLGLKKRGNRYSNDLYDIAKVRVHVDVKGGIGSVNLFAN